jgi:hypothetical protein
MWTSVYAYPHSYNVLDNYIIVMYAYGKNHLYCIYQKFIQLLNSEHVPLVHQQKGLYLWSTNIAAIVSSVQRKQLLFQHFVL